MTTPEQSNIMRAAMFLVRYGHMSLREVLDLKPDVLHLAAEKLGDLLREELDISPVREVFRPDGVDPAYLGPAAQRYEAEASTRLSGRACIVAVSPDGQPIHDVVVGRPITLRNDDNSGVRAWRWTLLSKPEGSTTLENPTSSKVNFTPDVAGTYVVRLQVNGAELASMRSEVQLHVVAATPAPEMVIAEVDGARRTATSPARQSLSFVDAAGRSILLRGRCMPESAGVDSRTWTYSGTWRTAQVEADAAVFSGWRPGELDLSKCDALVLAEAFHYLQRAATTVQLIHNDKSRFGIIGDFKASMTGTEARWSLHFALAQDTASAPERPGLVRELQTALNRYSAENGSNTPDFILAEYLSAQLAAFDDAVQKRAKWYGRMDRPARTTWEQLLELAIKEGYEASMTEAGSAPGRGGDDVLRIVFRRRGPIMESRGARVQVGVAEVDRWRASRREQIQRTAEAIKSTLRPTPTDPPSETTISFRELAQRNAERVELQRIHDLVHERRLRLQVESDDHVSYVDVIRGLVEDALVPSTDARDMTDLRSRAEAAEAELAQYRNLGLSENWGRLREALGVGQAANWSAVLEAVERVNKYKALADTAVETVDKLRITAPELLDLHTFVSRELAPLDPDLDRKNGESDIAWATRLLQAARGRGAFRLPTPRT